MGNGTERARWVRAQLVDPSGDRVEAAVPTSFVPLIGAMERLAPEDLAVVASMINRLATPAIEDSSHDT